MIVGFTVYTRVDGTEVDAKKLVIQPKPTIIYDKDGNQLAKFVKERKDVTKYEDIPEEMEQALLSTEDRDFYEHVGVNPKAILRAVVHDVKVGSFDQGGSTITQQLVKNIYLTSGKDLGRKQKEAIYATILEQELDKKQILTYYMNHADFIYNSFGVKNGIETYFGQSLEEFKQSDKIERIAKSALLMGLLQSPSENNPFIYPDNAMSRRNIVIHNMMVQHYITKDEYDAAIKEPLLTLDSPRIVHNDEKMYYPEIVSYVLEEIREKYNLESVDEARYIGKSIYTSFDPKVYEIIRKNIQRAELYPNNASDGAQVQSAITIVNPANGEILALTGGRQAPGFLEFNRAYQGQFQPGSSFKPLIAYGPAIESGKFTPWSRVPGNSGVSFNGYTVRNFGGQNYGSAIDLTTALTKSANVSAVYLLQQTGIQRAKDFAAKQGIVLADEDRYLPIALGALSIGVNPLKMADAFQGFSNGGYRIPAHIIKKVVSPDGKLEYEAPSAVSEDYRTMTATTAKYMKFMMRNGVLNGTGRNANIEGQFVAGKTGTAELAGARNRNRDIWFSGFTNTFVASIWMGFDNPNVTHSFSNQDTSWIAARMFNAIGAEVSKLYPSPLDSYKEPEKQTVKVQDFKLEANYSDSNKNVILSWDFPTAAKFKIYRNGELLHQTTNKTFENITIKQGETYTYKIEALDESSSEKVGSSNEVTITTGTKKETASSTEEKAKEEETETTSVKESQTNEEKTEKTTDTTKDTEAAKPTTSSITTTTTTTTTLPTSDTDTTSSTNTTSTPSVDTTSSTVPTDSTTTTEQ